MDDGDGDAGSDVEVVVDAKEGEKSDHNDDEDSKSGIDGFVVIQPPPFFVGEYVAMLETPGDDSFWLGEVRRVDNEEVVVDVFYTTASRLKKATWRPLFVSTDNKFVLGSRQPRGAVRYSLSVKQDEADDFIIARGLSGFRKNKTMKARTLSVLKSLKTGGRFHKKLQY